MSMPKHRSKIVPTTPVLRLFLLGSFQATIEERVVSAFATDKVRALLVYLALEVGIPHRRESLAALLYPDWSDSDALNNLRKTLFRLRSALDAHAPSVSDDLLLISRSTIELNGAQLFSDVAQFRQAATYTLSKGQLTDADITDLHDALMLYRGDLVAGLSLPDADPFEEWLLLQREALHQQALQIADVLATLHERRGMYEQAQIYVRQALSLESWREEAHLQLIRLLALMGQKSEAVAQYERCRRLLAEEMGAEPSETLRDLMVQVNAGTLAAPLLPATTTPLRRAALQRFPAQFTSFVGREEALATVLKQIQDPDCRLVTIVGAGGMGKTRLAVQVAKNIAQLETSLFGEGIYFVEGVSLTRVEDVPAAIAAVLGLPLQVSLPIAEQVHNFLRNKAVLLVVDNVEQIVACGAFFVTLLAECPLVKLIVTSREPLNIRAEWRYSLEGLGVEEGVASPAYQLFMQRARQVIPDFTPTDDDNIAILAMVALVEGSPLALEIAAMWLRFYDCATIVAEIAKGVDFLETELRDVPDRHRSVRAVFDQSWQFLTQSERKTLAQLSVLRGEWTLPQALAVAESKPRDIVTLVDKSLIKKTKVGRYTVHELVRQFAYGYLESNGTLEATQQRHARFFLQYLSSLQPDLYGMEPRTALATLQSAWGNVRLAWAQALELKQWEWIQQALPAYQMVIEFSGLVIEAIRDLEQVIERCRPEPKAQALLAAAGAAIASWHYRRGEYDISDIYVEMVLALPTQPALQQAFGQVWYTRAMGHLVRGNSKELVAEAIENADQYFTDPFWRTHLLSAKAQQVWKQGDLETSKRLFQEARTIFEQMQYPIGIMTQVAHLGMIQRMEGIYEQTLINYHYCLTTAERLNIPADIARHCNNIGAVHYYLKESDKAIDYFTRALEVDSQLGHLRGMAMEKGNIGLVYHQVGDFQQALYWWDEAVTIARRAGLKGVEANYVASRGSLFSELGEFEKAQEALEAGMVLARSIDNRPIMATYASNLAWVYFRLGQTAQAMVSIDEASAMQARFGMRRNLGLSLKQKAIMLLETGDLLESLTQFEAILPLLKEQDSPEEEIFDTKIKMAWLRHQVQGDATVLHDLEQWLGETESDILKAEIRLQQWRVTALESHRVAAVAAYEALSRQSPLYEYRLHLAELSK